MDNLMKCTSKNCIYKRTCERQVEEEPPSKYDEYFNYEYTCNFISGYNSYIKHIVNQDIAETDEDIPLGYRLCIDSAIVNMNVEEEGDVD